MSDVVKAAVILSMGVVACVGVLVWQCLAERTASHAPGYQRYALSADGLAGTAWLLDTESGKVWMCYLSSKKCWPFIVFHEVKLPTASSPTASSTPEDFDAFFAKVPPSEAPQ
jgi:hypothetical protein